MAAAPASPLAKLSTQLRQGLSRALLHHSQGSDSARADQSRRRTNGGAPAPSKPPSRKWTTSTSKTGNSNNTSDKGSSSDCDSDKRQHSDKRHSDKSGNAVTAFTGRLRLHRQSIDSVNRVLRKQASTERKSST